MIRGGSQVTVLCDEPVRAWLDAGQIGADPLRRPQRAVDVTVVIPAHDPGRHLLPCLESLRGYRSLELEVILIDDGSTDRAIEVAVAQSGLPQEQLVRVVRQPNRGASSARNLGLRLARGAFVSLLDADDLFAPQALTILHEAARQSSSDLVLCRSHLLDDETGRRSPFPDRALWQLLTGDRSHLVVEPELSPMVFLLSPSPCPRLTRRALIDSSGVRFPEGVRFGEDLTPHLGWIAAARRVHLVNQPLFLYRQKAPANPPGGAAIDVDDAVAALSSALAAARGVGLQPRSAAHVTYRLLARYAWQSLQLQPPRREAFLERGQALFAALPDSWAGAFLGLLAPDRVLLEQTTGRVLFDHCERHDYGILLRALRNGSFDYLREAFSSGPSRWRCLQVLARDGAWAELIRRALRSGP